MTDPSGTTGRLAGRTTITSSARLAQSLHQQFARAQQGSGATVWETPDILPFDAWLVRCWQQAEELGVTPAHRLLGDAEERLIWQQLVRKQMPTLLSIGQTAEAARRAWQLMQQWQLSSRSLSGAVGEDVRVFARWSKLYADQLADKRWIDSAGWAGKLADAELLKQLAPVDQPIWRVGFAGFDRMTPVQQALQAALTAAGCLLDEAETGGKSAVCHHFIAADDDDELYAIAQWARASIAVEPTRRLAVVLPQLQQRRRRVEAVFDQVFRPAQQAAIEKPAPVPVAIAVGEPLADYRLVTDGLNLLALLDWNFPLETASRVLLSPFVGHLADQPRRARLDSRLRELGKRQLKLADLINLIGQGRFQGIHRVEFPEFAEQIEYAFQRLKALPRQAPPSRWATLFAEQLSGFGWPGSEALDSELQQTFEAWQALVSQFSGLDSVAGDCTLAQARRLLEQLARQRQFQPLNRAASVQVLSTLEPWPDQFDAIWVAGLDGRQFPVSMAPNPFLPVALQRRLNMPGCSPQWNLQHARQQLVSWHVSGRQLYLSYARSSNDGESAPSQCFDWSKAESLPAEWLVGKQQRPAASIYRQVIDNPALVDIYDDSSGVPLSTEEGGPGGASLFQEQAECPFKAYLRRRLRSDLPVEPEPGLDPMQRGTLMHRVLEKFWQAVGGSEQLQEMPEPVRQRQVELSVAAAIDGLIDRVPALGNETERLLESERLEKLLGRWLQQELAREPFTVEGFEQSLEIQVGQLNINGRVDRIDRLADGRPVIIDYKSGEVNRKDWFDQRLLSPQLPLYQTRFDDAAGIAVAQLKPNKLQYVEAGEGGLIPNSRAGRDDPPWPELRDQWWLQLELLASEYAAGRADVSPARPAVCNYCELQLACRINENADAADDDEQGLAGEESH